jgi:uncharacterized protein with von Willebrand factor type A (vWA) domain
MDPRIVQALLSDEMLKTAEDAQAAGRIAAQAFADEWRRLDGLFKGAASEKEDEDEEGEDDEGEASEETEAEEKAEEAKEKAEESEKKGSEAEDDDEGEEGPVSPEDLAWLVENLGI